MWPSIYSGSYSVVFINYSSKLSKDCHGQGRAADKGPKCLFAGYEIPARAVEYRIPGVGVKYFPQQ